MDDIRVLVVDDHSLFRRGVIQTLRQDGGMTVVAEAESAAAAVEKAKEFLPDVILLDVKLPDGTGLAALVDLQSHCPYSKVIMLTVVEDEDVLLQALKGGAQGYLLKGVSGDELVRVVRAIHGGETYVSPAMAGRLLREMTRPAPGQQALKLLGELTERERAILQLVAQGLTNKEIGGQLYLSEKTVKHHMTNVLQKLQVRNRVEAVLLALKEKTPL